MSINFIMAGLALFFMALVARGFLPLLSVRKKDFLSYATLGIGLISSALVGRAFYWDVVRLFVTPETWETWRHASGGVAVNVIPNAMVIAGGVALLRARWLLIPEPDREDRKWNIFTAAFYPANKCIAVRVAAWRAGK